MSCAALLAKCELSNMIVKVKFREVRDDETFTMLFGTSYKEWYQQYGEYVRTYPTLEPIEAWKSKAAWIGHGGLKWCSEDEIQTELDRSGGHRKYSEFEFRPMKFSELPVYK